MHEKVYRKLQRHLDKQTIGFPATRSGVELNILKHIFNPSEAELTSHLSYKFDTVTAIYEKVKHLVESKEDLEVNLDRIMKKGGLELKTKKGVKHYCCSPLVVGMYEFQIERLTPGFIQDFKNYASTKSFGLDFISTKVPQMRTIPVKQSIQAHLSVSTFDEIISLLNDADGPFVILQCICRKKKQLEGYSCKATNRNETCLAVDNMAEMSLASKIGRKISKDEAISIIDKNQEEGLILQPSNTKKAEFLCSCCGCCCGVLNMHKHLPKPLNYWAANYFAVVNHESCLGCGLCEDLCQVDSIKVSDRQQIAIIDLDRCLGCGNCVRKCPSESITLYKKENEIIPPQTREELNKVIMEHKKGKFGKLLLAGNLIFETIKTGQTHLLR